MRAAAKKVYFYTNPQSMKKNLIRGLVLTLCLCCTRYATAQTTTKLQAMNHIKIVKTPSRPEDKFNNLLSNYQSQMQTAETQIQAAEMSLALLKKVQENLQVNLANMTDMSEKTQQQLQMAMDQRSKLMDMLSNILKSMNDTQNAIIQNLK
jgi:hypothetical protein